MKAPNWLDEMFATPMLTLLEWQSLDSRRLKPSLRDGATDALKMTFAEYLSCVGGSNSLDAGPKAVPMRLWLAEWQAKDSEKFDCSDTRQRVLDMDEYRKLRSRCIVEDSTTDFRDVVSRRKGTNAEKNRGASVGAGLFAGGKIRSLGVWVRRLFVWNPAGDGRAAVTR